jgi:predicted nuclease of predicted toxin-antitoxin system
VRFLLDENAEYRLAAFLRERGHEVTAVARDYPGALTDREVLAIALVEARILITNDRDFGELIVRERLPHAGVIYFRLRACLAMV